MNACSGQGCAPGGSDVVSDVMSVDVSDDVLCIDVHVQVTPRVEVDV